MKVGLHPALSDTNLDANQPSSQRQLSIAIRAISQSVDQSLPLNLCLILDHSGSMHGRPLETVKKAAMQLIERLKEGDRISVIAFDHRAKVLVPNQAIDNLNTIKSQIRQLSADGGTAIDEGTHSPPACRRRRSSSATPGARSTASSDQTGALNAPAAGTRRGRQWLPVAPPAPGLRWWSPSR